MSKIPFVDLQGQYQAIRTEILEKVDQVFADCAYIQGKYLEEFEAAFARAHGAHHAAGCSNGTTAISLALEALGIRSGDEVVVPVNTFIATAEAVCHVGATPVFADVDPQNYNVTAETLARALTAKTRAVLPVHLYGNPCDMNSLCDFVEQHSLQLVEDCAQAHLAQYKGKAVGTFGQAGTFSFYPGKNLGAYGDAGLVLTNDVSLAEKVKKLRDHGRCDKYRHDLIGYNSRMDGVQGAVLSVKLRHLPEWTEQRRRNAGLYDARLKRAGFKTLVPTAGAQPVYHLYVVELANRDAVAQHLKEKGISTGVHYPIPLHLQPAFAAYGYRPEDFPAAVRASGRLLSLPMYPELKEEQIDAICSEITQVGRP